MMRWMTRFIPLIMVIACAKQPQSTVRDAHPAVTAANEVLSAIHANDAEKIRPLLNATNQRKVSDADLGKFKNPRKFWGRAPVSELREHYREDFVAAKIRVVGREVFVVEL